MTEDFLSSSIYVGHSSADANLAQVEKAAEAKEKRAFEADGDVPGPTFTGAPIAFIRKAIPEFVELAKTDPPTPPRLSLRPPLLSPSPSSLFSVCSACSSASLALYNKRLQRSYSPWLASRGW